MMTPDDDLEVQRMLAMKKAVDTIFESMARAIAEQVVQAMKPTGGKEDVNGR